MNQKKPSAYDHIPTLRYWLKLVILLKCNEAKSNAVFTDYIKYADISPANKKEERTIAKNYIPVSILPSISKIFERNMYDQIYSYIVFISILMWLSQRF